MGLDFVCITGRMGLWDWEMRVGSGHRSDMYGVCFSCDLPWRRVMVVNKMGVPMGGS